MVQQSLEGHGSFPGSKIALVFRKVLEQIEQGAAVGHKALSVFGSGSGHRFIVQARTLERTPPALPYTRAMERWKQPSQARLRLIVGAWIFLVVYAIVSYVYSLRGDIGDLQAFQVSNFTRTMFMDIGLMASAAAFWIVVFGRGPVRFVVAAATLILGSFAFFPYLAWLEWSALKHKRPQ